MIFEKNTFERDIIADDKTISKIDKDLFKTPRYSPEIHYLDVASKEYFFALLVLRHYLKLAGDQYFASRVKAKNIDLFMLTSSISSPCGPGSDSQAIKINFGNLETFLVDSSQFGFEPLLLNRFDKVYCYLPSMRGELPDARHLNQFFHCEMEMKGVLGDLIPAIEGYIKCLCATMLKMNATIDRLSDSPEKSKTALARIVKSDFLPSIEFDDGVRMLSKNNRKEFVNFTRHGRDITTGGEAKLAQITEFNLPFWLKNFDRDRVPFYQKPCPDNREKTINADLIFPALVEGAFGGEVVGSGQRQDNPSEMYESLKRQGGISAEPYEWYINLRRLPNYATTSGFGLGIERFLAWALAKPCIKDVIIYPRLKNVASKP